MAIIGPFPDGGFQLHCSDCGIKLNCFGLEDIFNSEIPERTFIYYNRFVEKECGGIKDVDESFTKEEEEEFVKLHLLYLKQNNLNLNKMKCENLRKGKCFYGLKCGSNPEENCEFFNPLYFDDEENCDKKELVACGACGGSGEMPGDDDDPETHICYYCNGTGEMEIEE